MEEIKSLFREAMSRLAGGVSIVTTEVDGRPWGLTISACCSISVEPPLLMISLANKTTSTQAISKNNKFNVSLLGKEQQDIAEFGSIPGKAKFFDTHVESNNNKVYGVKDALVHIDCEVYNKYEAGDHTIFIGLVKNVKVGEIKDPLLYFQRNFGSFVKN